MSDEPLTAAAWEQWAREANEALAELSAKGARWWDFSCSHRRFQLVVGDPVGSNVAIMLFWANHLAGPTQWENQAIRVRYQFTHTVPLLGLSWILEDERVGFRAEAPNFMWAKDVDVCDQEHWQLWRPDRPTASKPHHHLGSD